MSPVHEGILWKEVMVSCYVNVIVPQVSWGYGNILRGISLCFLHHVFLTGESDPSIKQQYSRSGKKSKCEIFSLYTPDVVGDQYGIGVEIPVSNHGLYRLIRQRY